MNEHIDDLKEIIENHKDNINSLESASKDLDSTSITRQRAANIQLEKTKEELRRDNERIPQIINNINVTRPLTLDRNKDIEVKFTPKKNVEEKFQFDSLERQTLKRFRQKEEVKAVLRDKKPSGYANISNALFSNYSKKLINEGKFRYLKRNLLKANLQVLPTTYVSIIFFTTLASFFVSILVMIFFLFFNFGAQLPIITLSTEDLGLRFLKTFWVLFFIPGVTYFVMYFYPSLEKSSAENQIDQELPFATIHMASISGSMIEPSKIFSILVNTHDYPYLEKEFTKLLNEINVYGYDLVNSLRNMASNSPSKKLSELFNGLATTITSGGSLPEFFDKRSQSLLFDYRLEREKYTRTAETFMDIYISVVIAAPMIFMLLLMMMKISGLGVSLSTGAITLIMVLGVAVINVVFLTFLHLKQPTA